MSAADIVAEARRYLEAGLPIPNQLVRAVTRNGRTRQILRHPAILWALCELADLQVAEMLFVAPPPHLPSERPPTRQHVVMAMRPLVDNHHPLAWLLVAWGNTEEPYEREWTLDDLDLGVSNFGRSQT